MAPIKLSEAIRLGAMMNPQGFIGGDTPEEQMASINGDTTCALVAAHRAIGQDGLSWTAGWPWIGERRNSACPACGDATEYGVFITIIHLNDFHRWTREAIADWVETIERRADADSARTERETASTAVADTAPAYSSVIAQK